MPDLIPINVVIGDRTYRLKIDPADEETLRKTVKLINEKIIDFKTNFAGKDMQDYMAMAMLWFVTEMQKPGNKTIENLQLDDSLRSLEMLIDNALKK
jgi:cell division protein ZapA